MTNRAGSEDRRRVLVVGVGDDGPAGLSQDIRARVEQAEVLVGGRRHLELFSEVLADRVAISGDVEDVVRQIELAAEDRRVVVLASGDPCYFGIGPLLAARFGPDRVEIVPHVSAVALAFARLGVAWHDATVVSAHGRPLDGTVQAAIGASKLAVLTDETNTPAVVAEALLTAGANDAAAWVFEHLGGERETSTQSTLSDLSSRTFAPLNVLVAPELSWSRRSEQRVAFGLPAAAYEHSAGLITKPEIRAVTMSKLRLRAGGVLWDIGAGSGSLSIEAAGLAPDLRVYAVERSAQQLAMLHHNVAQYERACQVRVVDGEAPDSLGALPDPDAVFVGGSGGRLTDILDLVHQRIARHGRVVLNLIALEHVAATVAWARGHTFQAEVVQVAVARGAEIRGMTRLQAENPVTIVTIDYDG